jgi:CRISPR system Cascade subunit CasC
MIHTLKNYSASSLNRGKDGDPKSLNFGDTWRGRISSQAIKRSIRLSEQFDSFHVEGLIGIRTRDLPAMVGSELSRRGWEQAEIDLVLKKLTEIGKRAEKEDKELGMTNQIMLFPAHTPATIAQQISDLGGAAKIDKLEQNLKPLAMHSVDIALFGAMSTTRIFPNVYAACQVSHAMSVNRTQKAIDYFVAVDDQTGTSKMIGENLFNSNCYYHSICVDMTQLVKNLSGDGQLAGSVIRRLIEAVTLTSPGGKQNTFASHPLPALLLVEVIHGPIFDYANAFEKAVTASEDASLSEEAIRTLAAYLNQTDKLYNRNLNRYYLSLSDIELNGRACESLPDLLERVESETRWLTM